MGFLDRWFAPTKTPVADVPFAMGLGVDKLLRESSPSSFEYSLFQRSPPPERGSVELLAMYSQSPWVRAVSHKIALAVSGVEWKVYAQRGPGGKGYARNRRLQRSHGAIRRRMLTRAATSGDVEEITEHPLLTLLNSPNPILTGRDFHHAGQAHVDLVGESFVWWKPHPTLRTPEAMWVIPPTWVRALPTTGQPYYEIANPSGGTMQAPADFVIHVRDVDPSSPYGRGAGTGRSLSDEIDIDEFAAKHTSTWFHNRGMPDALVSLKGASKEHIDEARARWDNAVKGWRKAHRTHWTNAELTVQRLDTAFKDLELVQLREFERDTIVSVFGVPPEKLGILTNSNRATIGAADYFFARDVVEPRMERWRAAYQKDLVPLFDERLILDFEPVAEEDREFQKSIAQAFPAAFSVDEIRALANLPPLDDEKGAGFLVTQGTQYTDDLTKLAASSVFGYHLAAGVLTNNELRASMGLEPTPEKWGDERTVGTFGTPAPLPGAFARGLVTRATSRAMPKADQKKILASISAQDIVDEIGPDLVKLLKAFGQETIEEIDPALTFSLDDPSIDAFERGLLVERVESLINTTTKERLAEALADPDLEDPTEAIENVFADARVSRSQIIASTEVRRVSQDAATRAMVQSGAPVVREWLSTQDNRQRDAHDALDGQKVLVNEPFTVPDGEYAGAQAMHPGAFGIAALDVSCRCVAIPLVLSPDELAEFESERAHAPAEVRALTTEARVQKWRSLDGALIAWDKKVTRSLRRGFEKQRKAALAAIGVEP